MTMPYGSAEEPTVIETEEPTVAVRVVSSGSRSSKTIGTEFGRWNTILVTSAVGASSTTPGAQRLANRSLRRKRMRIFVNAASSGSTPNSGVSYASANGAVTSPAAGGVLATTGILPAGTYVVNVNANLAGTVAQGTDNNNLRVTVNGATYTILPNDIVAGPQTFGPFTVTTNGATAILVQANAAGSAGSIYAAQVTATPVAGSGGGGNSPTDGVLVGSRGEICSGQPATPALLGGYLQIGDNADYESQQELWVAYPSTNSGPVYVTTLDQIYASDPFEGEPK